MCQKVLKMISRILLSSCYSVGARFLTIPSLRAKGGKARWHLKSAFPSSLCQSVLFFLTDRLLHLHTTTACTHKLHTDSHKPLPSPSPLTMMSLVTTRAVCLLYQTLTSGPLNDTYAGCGVTWGPIKNQTQHQTCHIHSCDELLDVALSMTGCQHLCQDDRLAD